MVGPIGLGLKSLTWTENPVPDEEAFRIMNYALSHGCSFWDAGEFYGLSEPLANLQLLSRYFQKFPDSIDKVFLSVKGAFDPETHRVHGTRECITKSIKTVRETLKKVKTIDLYQCAAIDPDTPIEETMACLKEFVDSGDIRCIGLCEPSVEEIKRAHSVVRIAAIEVHYSMLFREIEYNGVKKLCHDLSIPLVAHSPLAHGLLTGRVTTMADIENLKKHHQCNEQPPSSTFSSTLPCIQALKELASKYDMSLAELALSFILSAGRGRILPIPSATSYDLIEASLGSFSKVLDTYQFAEVVSCLEKTLPPPASPNSEPQVTGGCSSMC